ncbi:hypothetical protein H2248_008481 [Termitomyces sp. 'cryptogamus']|nr:hypothetical protein H2248_008481 [Termitomyces sp. 'cryptogamus']
MEDSSIYDYEVIPGSDEEENSLIPLISDRNDCMLEDRVSQDTIQTPYDVTVSKHPPISSISDRTTGSSSAPKPRPKPRPLKKRPDMSSSNTPHREKTAASSDVLMDFDLTVTTDIAERAKIRSRNRPQTQRPNLPTSDIIELSSDDDDDDFNIPPPSKRRKTTDKTKTKSAKKSKPKSELVEAADPKPRPRPRPLKKPKQGANAEQISPISLITQDKLIATSSIFNDTFTVPSQLPPSDPPSSTASSYDHPPITILPPLLTDPEPSSPCSPLSIGKKNRMHAMLPVDELDSESDPLAGDAINADTRLMPPPPFPGPPLTSFPGSPSPLQDDTPATSTTSRTKTSAVKKARKKKSVPEDDIWGTNKVKAKANQKKTSPRKVEVVINKPNVKEKGKKEDLKSREFIDDDDDDDSSNKVSATALSALKRPKILSSFSPVPENDTDGSVKARPSKERKSVDREVDELDTIGRTESSSECKRRVFGRSKRVIDSDNEDMPAHSVEAMSSPKAVPRATSQDVEISDATGSNQQADIEKESQHNASLFKENARPSPSVVPQTPQASARPGVPHLPSLSSRYTIAPKTRTTPMSDLIRRVNSKPGSPFCSPVPRNNGANSVTPGTAYSPYMKASRTALSRIAPLHPNRRTPPPPPPPPPPKKKTKKELEREEQWEEELIEGVGGITEWACMSDAERAEMRKAKRERETHGWED